MIDYNTYTWRPPQGTQTTKTVEVCEYDGLGKLVKRTVTTTTDQRNDGFYPARPYWVDQGPVQITC